MGEAESLSKLPLPKSRKQWIILSSVIGVLLVTATGVYSLHFASQPAPEPPPPETAKITSVSALGRIEPLGEAIQLSPPPTMGGAKVKELLVAEGDRVEEGEIVAVLDNFSRLEATVERAKQEVTVAEANLAKVKAGAKQGEIAAAKATVARLQEELRGEITTQQATISRLQAELRNAESEFGRYASLAREGAISQSELDSRRLTLETARERLEEAKSSLQQTQNTLERQIEEANANLDQIAEIRPVDVQQAQAEVNRAIASLRQAQADLELGYIESPINGQVLKINAYPGEMVSQSEGILEIGQTESMVVVAEVYETDISKVQLGQKAKIISEGGAFSEELEGTVQQIGLQIGKRDVLDTDPTADVDARVVEVDILLTPEGSEKVSRLTNSQVIVEILL